MDYRQPKAETGRAVSLILAIMSDIHANREAFEACLASAASAGADRLVLLGDIVGYGADPVWCATKAMELVGRGALAVRGNHDDAISQTRAGMNPVAQAAIDWTRGVLAVEHKDFLAELPLEVREDDCLFVHADASAPLRWNYVTDKDAAARHFAACSETFSFCGHVHRPALFSLPASGKIVAFKPNSMQPIPLLAQRRWLAVMGAVGQPRDGNPAAAYGLLDTQSRQLHFMRVAYDIDAAVAKIRAAGLPDSLASRLLNGY